MLSLELLARGGPMKNFLRVCLVLAVSVSTARADSVTVNAFNNGLTSNNAVTVHYNDGVGDSGTVSTWATQFNVTFNNGSSTATFNTFCIDLFHDVTDGQTYAVYLRNNLATAFTNGSQMAYIYENFGVQNLTGNSDQAAAVQLALWDLSLNNHTPTSFGLDSDGTYSSGDENVFSVVLNVPDASQIASLVNQYLQAAVGASGQGSWLDASAQGNYLNRGQSLLVPDSLVPEPSSILLSLVAAGCLSVWSFRGHCRRPVVEAV